MMNNSIHTAIQTIVNKKPEYSTNGMTWSISGFSNSKSMWIVDDTVVGKDSTGLYSDSYVPGFGAVLKHRGTYSDATYSITDYKVDMAINVRGPMLYTKSQWQSLADQIMNYLSIYEKAYFWTEVDVS